LRFEVIGGESPQIGKALGNGEYVLPPVSMGDGLVAGL